MGCGSVVENFPDTPETLLPSACQVKEVTANKRFLSFAPFSASLASPCILLCLPVFVSSSFRF